MKSIKGKSFKKATRGSTIVLISAASASVLLSIFLLFGYVSDMSDRQSSLEESVQVALAEETAVDYALFMYGTGMIPPEETLPPLETAGFYSHFKTIETTAAGSRIIEYRFPGVSNLSAVSASPGIVVAGNSGDSLAVYYRIPCESNDGEQFSIRMCSKPDNWILSSAVPDMEYLCILACDYPGMDGLFAVNPDGSFRAFSLGEFEICSSSKISSGITENGPVAVITDGSSSGLLVDLEDGSREFIVSSAGTCPVVLPDGRLFGEISSVPPARQASVHPEIEDVLFGDFDLDGTCDAAWASSESFSCFSSAMGLVVRDDPPSGQLTAWGFLDGVYGLGGLWSNGNREYIWRKFVVTGFTELENSDHVYDECRGRITPDGYSFAAIQNGLSVIASNSSGQSLISIPGGIAGDFDNSGALDIVNVSDGSALLHIDPAGPESILMTVEILTSTGEDESLSSTLCSIHAVPGGIDASEQRTAEGRNG